MKNGTLTVPKEQVALQQLLSIYHPLKDKIYKELNKEQDSVNQIDWIELELEALTAAKNLRCGSRRSYIKI